MSRAIVISLVACALSNAAFAETIKLACHFNEEVSFPSECRSCHQSHELANGGFQARRDSNPTPRFTERGRLRC